MSNIYGNYWDETQVRVGKAGKDDFLPFAIYGDSKAGTPAFLAIIDPPLADFKYIFVEIVPNTEQVESYVDMQTGQTQVGTCVLVNVYKGADYKFESMTKFDSARWPLQWFNLTQVPTPPPKVYDSYERAMSVIGK